jgi:hypothetical protein
MGDFDLMASVVAFGLEFKRRKMETEAKELRRYYVELRERRKARLFKRSKVWTENQVIDWLCLLRMPPFENVYTPVPHGTPCPKCGVTPSASAPTTIVCLNFPGGWMEQCRTCGARWLHEEPPPG